MYTHAAPISGPWWAFTNVTPDLGMWDGGRWLVKCMLHYRTIHIANASVGGGGSLEQLQLPWNHLDRFVKL